MRPWQNSIFMLRNSQRGYYFQSFVLYFTFGSLRIILIRGTMQMVVNYREVHAKAEHSARLDGAQSIGRTSSGHHNDYAYYPRSNVHTNRFYHSYIKYSDKKTECQNCGSNKNNFHQPEGKNPYAVALLFPISIVPRHQGYDLRRRSPMTKVYILSSGGMPLRSVDRRCKA